MYFDFETYLKENLIVSLYFREEDTERFFCGKIAKTDEEFILINHITPVGLYDGYVVIKKSAIYRVNKGGTYEDKMKVLYEINKTSIRHKSINIINDNIVSSLLQFAKKNNSILNIELFNSDIDDVQGIISDYSEDKIELYCYDNFGNPDGKTEVLRNDISLIKSDNENCHAIQKIIKFKSTQK